MELRRGYKKTEIGVIPDDWELKTLDSLTSLLTNGFVGTATSAYVDGDDGVLYIQGYNIQENGFNFHGIKRVSKSFHAKNPKSCLQSGDLLTIQTGDIGVTAVVPQELAGANCHALIISRFHKGVSEPHFYCQYFNSERGRVAFKAIETGTTMKHLNGGDMKRLLLPSPSIAEQRALAEALSDVDASIAALLRLIAKKRDLRQGAMQRLLTGQSRLPGFTAQWKVKRLAEFGKCLRGVSYDGDADLFASDSAQSIRLLRANNVQDARIDARDLQFVNRSRVKEVQRLQPFDIVICTANGSRALVGKSALFTERDGYDYTFGAFMGCLRISLKDANPVFVHGLLNSDRYAKLINLALAGSTINNLAPSVIEAMEFAVPELEEQSAIARVLSDFDSEIVALDERLDKTRTLKRAMMQALLTGRVRLPLPREAAPETQEAAYA